MELDELCNLYPRGHPRLENELNQLKRKLGVDDQLFNSSDDGDLCAELDSVERKCKKKLKSNDNFLCDVCGKQLKHRQSLDSHLQSHFSTFRCRCGKTFKYIYTRKTFAVMKNVVLTENQLLLAISATKLFKQFEIWNLMYMIPILNKEGERP